MRSTTTVAPTWARISSFSSSGKSWTNDSGISSKKASVPGIRGFPSLSFARMALTTAPTVSLALGSGALARDVFGLASQALSCHTLSLFPRLDLVV